MKKKLVSIKCKFNRSIHLEILIFLLIVLIGIPYPGYSDIPRRLNYQGKLEDSSGNPVQDGEYKMMFKLYQVASGGTPIWKEEWSTVTVTDSMIKVALGTYNEFSNLITFDKPYWLEVSIYNTTTSAWDSFTPRDELACAPYAFRSLKVADGSIDNTAVSGISGEKINSGIIDNGRINWSSPGEIGASSPADGHFANLFVSGNVGIGTDHPGCKAEIIDGAKSAKFCFNTGAVKGAYGEDAAGYLGLKEQLYSTKLYYGVYGIATTTYNNYGVFGKAYGGINNWAGYFSGNVYVSNNVGIGVARPKAKLHVVGDTYIVGNDGYNEIGDRAILYLGKKGDGDTGESGIMQEYGFGLKFGTFRGSGWGSFGRNSIDSMVIRDGSGHVGIGTLNPTRRLEIADKQAILRLTSSDTCPTLELVGPRLDEMWKIAFMGKELDIIGDDIIEIGAIKFNEVTSMDPHSFEFQSLGRGLMLKISKKLTFYGNLLLVNPDTKKTMVELGEGLDYTEGFHVSDQAGIGPGTVLVIDPDNPGKLNISREPYDRKVAGIVAGAKGLGSGVRLGAGQFDYDVALAGRVYCNVDAAYGAVEPGDLLTTSPSPGYAMKVSDYKKAPGAVLGKAMEKLEPGKKVQIMVLVTLQ